LTPKIPGEGEPSLFGPELLAAHRPHRIHSHVGSGQAADIDSKLGDPGARAAEYDDLYALSVFALAAMDANRKEAARPARTFGRSP